MACTCRANLSPKFVSERWKNLMECRCSQFESEIRFGEVEEILDEVEKKFMRLKKFDVLQSPPEDHHYTRPNSILFSGLKNQILPITSLAKEAIQQEWNILQKRLPNWIYVRAYHSRINLMRAAIAGLENTPYRYGLFFFDIFIPYNYPAQPPQVFYHSYGHAFIDSKLQRDGRVSLPILEYGNWVSQRFNILEILKFIQHSVLCFEASVPKLGLINIQEMLKSIQYYDESAFEYSILKEQLERKVLFMQTCELMLSILKKPPREFSDFVAGFFRKWAHRILLCYKEEMQNHESVKDLELFLKLLRAFEANGTYCRHHYDHKLMSILNNDRGLK